MADLTGPDRSRLAEMIERDWVQAGLVRDWNASLALCSDDLVYMPQDHPIVRGKKEAKAFFDAFPNILRFTQAVQAVSGDSRLAVIHGTFDATVRIEDKDLSGTGKFLSTATKQTGQWLFTAVCFNWDAPLNP